MREGLVSAARVSAPAVETDGLVKVFGGTTPALLKFDLTLAPGSVCGLVGTNGAGKTTLLRILATGLRPTSGRALVHGLDVATQAAAVRRATVLVPAREGFYPELSAVENLRFAAAMSGRAVTGGELQSALVRVGLGRASGDAARSFSAGMVRRLALARLIVTPARLTLLDEPYASLDDGGRDLVDELLRELRAEGRTAIVATHDRVRIWPLADVILRLHRGVLVERMGSHEEAVDAAALAGP